METNESTPVLYNPAEGHVHDLIDGEVTLYGKHPVGEVLAEYPALVQISLGDAADRAHVFARAKYGAGRAERVSEKRFWEMLEVLPPCKWGTRAGFEMFHVSERISGSLVDWYLRDTATDQHWHIVEDSTAKPAHLAQCIKAA